MKKTILIIGVSILVLIGITMSIQKESDEIGVLNQYFNFLAGEINETQTLESGMNPTGSFIGTSGKNWVFNIIEEDLDVEMEIEAINETMIELTLNLINESKTANNYKWDMALCNIEGIDNLQYMNEDAQGGFNYSVPLNVNYGNLTNYGMNSSWCDITNGLGYVLFSGGSKNQLPKHIRLILPENATEFMLYAGSGSLIMDVGLIQGTSPVATQHLCISGGKCHGVFAGADMHYANTTYDSATESCHASWSNKTIFTPATGDTGILCFPNESISIYYIETATDDLDMLQSDDNGDTFGNAQTIADTAEIITRISGAVDSNNDAHFVFIAVLDAWYVNLSNADSEREIATATSDRVNIIVDDNNNQYIGITESTTDALTVMSSKDGFTTRNIWQDGASVGNSDFPSLAVCGNGTLYGAWTDTADLQFCETTTDSWTTATCAEIDADNSGKATIMASKNCDPYILYDDGTNLVLANKTDGGSFSVRRILISTTDDGVPAGVIIPSSSVPDKTLNYVHSSSTEVHYDNISIQQAPVYTLTITDPTTSAPLTNVVSGQTITISFNFTKDGVSIISGVTMDNVTVGGNLAELNYSGGYVREKYTVAIEGGTNWTVPSGVSEIQVKSWGAGGAGRHTTGGADGGGGGHSVTNISVTPGENLSVRVGGGGNKPTVNTYGGGGGGYSGVFRSSTPLIMAGGGGGGGGGLQTLGDGGAGGGLSGIDGVNSDGSSDGGDGGTQSAGGAGGTGTGANDGESGEIDGRYEGGDGADGSSGSGNGNGIGGINGGGTGGHDDGGADAGGGGGGGYYGGGGGEGGDLSDGAGGGGGSGYFGDSGTPVAGNGTWAGSGTSVANSTDSDYSSYCLANSGVGGASNQDGNDGCVVLIYYSNTVSVQLAYSTDKGVWEVNITAPSLADGTYDLFLNATLTGGIPFASSIVLNNTQTNAITYGAEAPSNSCSPASPLTSNHVFECSDNCNQTTELNAGNYNILINGTGTFTMIADIINHNATTIKGISESEKCYVTCLGGCFRD